MADKPIELSWKPRPGSGWDKKFPGQVDASQPTATSMLPRDAYPATAPSASPQGAVEHVEEVEQESSQLGLFGAPEPPPPPAPPPSPVQSEQPERWRAQDQPRKVASLRRAILRAPRPTMQNKTAGAELALSSLEKSPHLREPLRLVDPTPLAQQRAWGDVPTSKGVIFQTAQVEDAARDTGDPVQDMANRLRRWGEVPGSRAKEVSAEELAADLDRRSRADLNTPSDFVADTVHGRQFRSPSRSGELPGLRTGHAKSAESEGVADLFARDTSSPVALLDTLERMFGDGWMGWEWETIESELARESITCHAVTVGKILALRLLLNSPAFWEDVRAFANVVRVFNNRTADWSRIVQLQVHEMAVGVTIAQIVRPYAPEWGADVRAYVAGNAILGGFLQLPPELIFAEWDFSNELIKRMGDAALLAQQELGELLDPEFDIESLGATMSEDIRVQLIRLHRVRYAVQAILEAAQ